MMRPCSIMHALLLTTLVAVAWTRLSCDQSDACPAKAQALLQSHRKVSPRTLQDSKLLEESLKVQTEKKSQANTKEASGVNPSGAEAPLDETGYSAVADRCCQAEMKQFIERQVIAMGMDVCDADGLTGIVPYHSCEHGVQTFDVLTANLLSDSQGTCAWLANTGACTTRDPSCPEFTGLTAAADCGCHRSKAATLDFTGSTVSISNLGGVGPDTGAQELRYSNIGTTETGEKFDIVVTALTEYRAANPSLNGNSNGFGVITTDCLTAPTDSTDFKFSFVQPGTNTPVLVSEIHMAIFDLDGIEANGVEVAASKGYRGYVTDETPSVLASRLADGRTKFSSSQAIDNVPNPTNPDSLTTEQRQNSLMYFYQNVTEFELTFGIETCRYSRNLFFSGTSELNDRCGP